MALAIEAEVTPDDIAFAMDEAPDQLYVVLHALAVGHEDEGGHVEEDLRDSFLISFCSSVIGWHPAMDLAAGHAVNRLLQEMTKELSGFLLRAEEERRRHAS